MPLRTLRTFLLATASLFSVSLPLVGTGCSSAPSAATSTGAASPDAGASAPPPMLDGLYVSDAPASGPYAQITFIGYTNRYLAELSACPADASSCEELGSFSTDVDGELELTADGTGKMTSLPYAAGGSVETGTRAMYAAGAPGAVGSPVTLIFDFTLGGVGFHLINSVNGAPVSTSNPPAMPPVGMGTGSGTDAGTGAGSVVDAGPPAKDTSCPVSAASWTDEVNPAHLLDECELEGGATISASDVQTFLENRGSYLAQYTEGGKSAEIIVSNATASGISPLYIVARIETESSLIESGTANNILTAAGCACPDTAPCSAADSGFGNQITCAAKLMSGYLHELEGGGETVSGWKVGKAHATSDPCNVTPNDAAPAAPYTSDPWVRAYSTGCGTKKWGGATLFAHILQRYHQELN